MDAKLNHSDLSALLAKEAKISQAKAELLTKAFFEIIIEGLEQDGSVKINTLGTFKITDVASRSSVNVNTGEKFEIKGHGKLSFVPADSLKDVINQPFAMFEPVEVDDTYCEEQVAEESEPIETETVAEQPVEQEIVTTVPVEIEEEMPAEYVAKEEATASVSIIEEEQPYEECAGETPQYEPRKEPVVENIVEEFGIEETVTTEPVGNEDDTAVEDSVGDVAVEENVSIAEEPVTPKSSTKTVPEEDIEEPVIEKSVAEEAVLQEKPHREPVLVTVPKKEKPVAVETKKSKSKFGMYVALFAVIVLVLAGGFYFINSNNESVPVVKEPVAVKVEQPLASNTDATASATIVAGNKELALDEEAISNLSQKEAETEQPYTFVMVNELAETPLAGITVADTMLYIADGEFAKHIVTADETLTKIAFKYFGDKKLWPYIVKYNNLAKPNDLCKGMEISIPRLKPAK